MTKLGFDCIQYLLIVTNGVTRLRTTPWRYVTSQVIGLDALADEFMVLTLNIETYNGNMSASADTGFSVMEMINQNGSNIWDINVGL